MALLLKCYRNKLSALVLIIVTLFSIGAHAEFKLFQSKTITVGTKTLVVEVADNPDQHARGLMFREKLGKDDGMLFIFDEVSILRFWMKNTLIDLSIGYFDGSGTLIDIQEMKSGKGIPEEKLINYPSAKPAKYALEMNKGWFAKNKIKLGTKLKIK